MSLSAPGHVLSPRLPRAVLGQSVAGLGVAAAAGALAVLASQRSALNVLVIVLVIAGSLWFATTRRTPLALALLMIYYGALDGYLKLATGSSVVTFVRDGLLYALVIGLLLRATIQRRPMALPPLGWWVVTYMIVVLVQLANPQAGSFTHSLAGLRQDLEFVPLFFLTYMFVRTVKALRVFVILLVVIAAANGVAGWIQFNESPQQFAAWGPGYAQRVLGQGLFEGGARTFSSTVTGLSHTRPFGLGSDAGTGGIFGAFALAGILALAAMARRLRYLLFAMAMAVAATTAIVTSEGRGVVIAAVVIVFAFGLLTAVSKNRVRTLMGLLLAGTVAFFVVHAIVGAAGGASALRFQGLTPSKLLQTTDKARGGSIALIPDNMAHYPLGAGLATAGPASGAVGGASHLTGVVNAESEFSYLTLEAGIPAVLLITGFTIALLVVGFRRCRHEPDREVRLLLAAIIAPLAGELALYVASAPTNSIPGGPYLWAAGGIISYWLISRPQGGAAAA